MADVVKIMALGFSGRQLADLKPCERRTWADRFKGYLIFPNDKQEEQRLRYQACKAANRIEELKETFAGQQKAKRRSACLSAYLQEERTYFESVGGIPRLIEAQGIAHYHQCEVQMYLDALALWRVYTDLMLIRNAPDIGAYGIHIAFDMAALRNARQFKSVRAPVKARVVQDIDIPKGLTRPPGNVRDLEGSWNSSLTVLPYLLVLGMLMGARRNDIVLGASRANRPDLDDYIAKESEIFLKTAGALEATLQPPAGGRTSKHYPKPDTLWRLPEGFASVSEDFEVVAKHPPMDSDDRKRFETVWAKRKAARTS